MEIVRLPKVTAISPRHGGEIEPDGICAPAHLSGERSPMQMPLSSPVRTDRRKRSAQLDGEILLWQSWLRVSFALAAGAVGIAAMAGGLLPDRIWPCAASVVCYVVVVLTLRAIIRHAGEATGWIVYATVGVDVLFVFGDAFLVIPPQYYEHTLLLSFVILHFTELYFGRRPAAFALATIIEAYIGLIWTAWAEGVQLSWPWELWSLNLFVLAAISFLVQYENVKDRLARIVDLFERAREGDLSGEYDVAADRRPDGITMVGRVYNQVRGQLANMVLTDSLSGCSNRRGLEQELTRELARAVRSGREISMIALDVDFFKTVNDTFGHLAGDSVIREIGALLREAARGGDVVARTGGDEFMLLLPETSAAGAYRLAMRIRSDAAQHRFGGIDGKVPITVSVGIVADRVVDENIAHDLLSRADEALYSAKDAGRNRVTIWTPNLRTIAVARAKEQILVAK